MFAFLAWTLLGVLSFAQNATSLTYRGMPIDWFPRLPTSLADWWTCGVFTPAFYWMVRRFPIRGREWWTSVPAHLAASAVFVVLKIAIYTPIFRWLHPGVPLTLAMMLAGNAFADLLGYWGAVGVIHAVEYYRESQQRALVAAKLDGELRAAELENLKAQLQPHFLFNTLQAISTLIHRDPTAADRMLTDLSDLLRVSLRHTAAQEVPLRDELGFLTRYLDIMRVRFGDRLAIEVGISPELLEAMVPSLVLQPLAENAIRHGMEDRSDSGRVEIRARHEGDSLVLEVADDGPGLPSGDSPGSRDGIGLANTQDRLSRLYGSAHTVAIRPAREGSASVKKGLIVEIRIPFRTQGSRPSRG